MRQKPSESRRTIRTKDRIEYKVLAGEFKKLRKKAKLSQAKLSRELGRDLAYINKIENGLHYPDFVSILDIVKLLGGDPLEVIGRVIEVSESKRSQPS